MALFAHGQSYKFKEFTLKDGLPQDYIYSLAQDQKGNLVIGTGEGLAIFNSKSFVQFNSKSGLENDFIQSSITTRKGKLWLGHFDGGITLFNNSEFIKLKLDHISQSPVNVLFETNDGSILAGTKSNGIIKINADLKVEVYDDIIDFGINSIIQDSTGHIFFGTEEGIYKFSMEQDGFHLQKKAHESLNIQYLYFDQKQNQIIAGTRENGLALMDLELDNSRFAEEFSEQNINQIVRDTEGNFYISSFGEGVYKSHFKNGKFIITDHYRLETGLSGNYIKTLYIDRENNIWMGSYGNGLSVLMNPLFSLYTRHDGLAENSIIALSKYNNDLWVATERAISYLPKTGAGFQKLRFPDIPQDISTFHIKDSIIYTGTTEHGIYNISLKDSSVIQWFYQDDKNLQNTINDIEEDKFGNLWIATNEGAFRAYSNIDGDTLFQRFTIEQGLAHNKIYAICCDSRNRIWFATRGGGLSMYQNGKITTYPSPVPGRSFDINCFAEDDLGGLWIGTYGQGIYLFQNGKFLKKLDEEDGLKSPYCYFLKFDQKNHLWIGHQNGLSKLRPLLDKFTYYENSKINISGNIQSQACVKDHFGNLWIGSESGLLKYSTSADKPRSFGPVVNLTGILLNFQKTDWSEYTDSLIGIEKIPLNLTLPYNKNHLTFNVMGVSLNPDAENIIYQYKLNGFDKEWSLKTNEPFITYSNLPPGKYNLKVRAGTKNGKWSEIKNGFYFEIESPFWKTWWFMTCSAALGVVLIYLFIKIRTDKLRQQRERLKRDKEILQAEIDQRIIAQEKQKVVEEKLKQTNQELNNFIYRSSHDLRGPISTVKGLTQLGVVEVKDPDAQKFFTMILDRTTVLDAVLKNLINIVEVIEGDINAQELNLTEITDEVIRELNEERDLSPINFKINISEIANYYNDFKLIKTIIYNILDNSVKYRKTNFDSHIFLDISKDSESNLVIKNIDNGVGISPEIMPRIFDMFYRGSDESKGSGLGLYTVRKIIAKLNGTLKIESKVNFSTTVHISIPSFPENVQGPVKIDEPNPEELAEH